MQEYNNDNPQYKYEEMDRPVMGGNKFMHNNWGWNNPWQGKWGGNQWHNWGGNNWPVWNKPFFPGFGFPWWFWFTLRSMNPRDAARFIEEMGIDIEEIQY